MKFYSIKLKFYSIYIKDEYTINGSFGICRDSFRLEPYQFIYTPPTSINRSDGSTRDIPSHEGMVFKIVKSIVSDQNMPKQLLSE